MYVICFSPSWEIFIIKFIKNLREYCFNVNLFLSNRSKMIKKENARLDTFIYATFSQKIFIIIYEEEEMPTIFIA
jgi:hypothetical protein